MLAECIVAVGTMLIPLAIVLLVTIEDFPRTWAYGFMILGTIALIAGLIIAIRNEIRASKKGKRLVMIDNLKRRLDKANFIILLHTSKKLGVDIGEATESLSKELAKDLEQELKDLENEM